MSTSIKRRHFNELALRWDLLSRPDDTSPRAKEFVGRASRTSAERILDVGCGTGILVPYILSACPRLRCLVELDFAEEMLRENARKLSTRHVARLCADAQALPFPDACFDLVLCFGVLPHFTEPQAALQQLWRVLQPSGRVAVGHLMSSAELNAFHRSMEGPVAGDTLPAAESLAQMFRQLGATVVTAEEKTGWYFVAGQKAPE